MSKLPQIRMDLTVQDSGDDVLVYDDRRERIHVLNSTAKRIWQLCDGAHDVDQIAAEIQRLFPGVETARIRQDVERMIEGLIGRGLVYWVAEEVKAKD